MTSAVGPDYRRIGLSQVRGGYQVWLYACVKCGAVVHNASSQHRGTDIHRLWHEKNDA